MAAHVIALALFSGVLFQSADLDDVSVDVDTQPARAPQTFVARISAYCLRGTMAGGRQVYAGAAAGPTWLDLGTALWIDGVGPVTVADRGSAVVGNRLDLWMSDCDRAMRWGVQERLVTILD